MHILHLCSTFDAPTFATVGNASDSNFFVGMRKLIVALLLAGSSAIVASCDKEKEVVKPTADASVSVTTANREEPGFNHWYDPKWYNCDAPGNNCLDEVKIEVHLRVALNNAASSGAGAVAEFFTGGEGANIFEALDAESLAKLQSGNYGLDVVSANGRFYYQAYDARPSTKNIDFVLVAHEE